MFWEDDNIIQIYQAGLPAVTIEDDIQGMLEMASGVLQPKGYELEPSSPFVSCERGSFTTCFLQEIYEYR